MLGRNPRVARRGTMLAPSAGNLFSPRYDLPVTRVQVAATRVLGFRDCAAKQLPPSRPLSMYPYGSENPGGWGRATTSR